MRTDKLCEIMDPFQKRLQAVCPTCKDRVSQRMGYARMAEEGFDQKTSEFTIHVRYIRT